MQLRLLLAAAAAVFAAACGGETVAAPAPTPTPDTSAPGSEEPNGPTSPSPAPLPTTIAGEWKAPFSLALEGGWTLTECLGDALDICVTRDGEVVGNLELAEYPLEDPDAEPAAIVRSHAEDFLRFFADDRAQGCADFEFVAEEIVPANVGGEDGLRTGFRLLAADGRVVEQVIVHYVVHDGVLMLVNTDAYPHEGGCLGQSETDTQFVPEVLRDFAPYVDAIVAGTPLPDASITG